MNTFGQEFFGYPADEIVGQNVVGTIVPEIDSSGRDLREMIADISRDPEAHAANENENVRKNGERVWMAWTNTAIRNQEGEVVELLCVGSDMTERRQLQAEILEVSESVRRRIGAQLHDSVGQQLASVVLLLGASQKQLTGASEQVIEQVASCLSVSMLSGLPPSPHGLCRRIRAPRDSGWRWRGGPNGGMDPRRAAWRRPTGPRRARAAV